MHKHLIRQESEQSYRSLLRYMLNGYALCKIVVDEANRPVDFEYIDVNDAFERLTGLRKEDVVGKRATDVTPRSKQSGLELLDIYSEVASTGKPIQFNTYIENMGLWLKW